MASSAFRSTTKGTIRTPLPKSSVTGDHGDASSSARRTGSRRYRSLSRFSHRMPDLDADTTPVRKEKFVNTVRGSGFPEVSLDDLAVDFFDSLSADSSGISSGERGRSGLRKSDVDGESTAQQRRGRSVSRAIGSSSVQRLTADTESSRRRRSVSRKPLRGNAGNNCGTGSDNSGRRRSLSRQPARGESGNIGYRGTASSQRRRSLSRQPARGETGNLSATASTNSRRRRSLSVVGYRINDSETEVDHVPNASNQGKSKNSGHENGQITRSLKPAISNYRPSLRRSFSQKEIKCHDGYSSHSSTVTDDEGKDTHIGKHGGERIIRTVYTQNKLIQVTPRSRGSSRERDHGSNRRSCDPHHAIFSITKDYATKLQESEERKRDLLAEILIEQQRGEELSTIVKELLTENTSEVSQKPTRARKRTKDRSQISTCLTDEAEKYIEEFISAIEDTDFSSLEDERSETSSIFGVKKADYSQRTAVLKCVSVETDGVMLPWLQWETSADISPCPKPSMKSKIWESDTDPNQDASTPEHNMSIHSMDSLGSWNPCDSANQKITRGEISSSGPSRLKIDVADYCNRPNDTDFMYESWKLRHRINSGSLVLYNRSLI